MNLPLRLTLAALVVGVVGPSPARAQQPVPAQPRTEAEIKALEERLRVLMRELRERETRKAANPEAKPAQPAPGTRLPVQPGWMVVPAQPPMDPGIALLHGLARHPDPKIAALAKELLERMAKAPPPGGAAPAPRAPGGVRPIEIEVEFVPDGNRPGVPFVVKPAPRLVVKDEAVRGTSTLKMSADGKTAAVVSADSSVVVYDVATGRELMRFGK
jgi:hypothetical protein